MAREIIIAPSLLAADFSHLADEIKRAELAGADWLHLDIMDGHFVKNITIGPVIVEWIRKITALPLDTHLMIETPEHYIDAFIKAGADSITFHAEVLLENGCRLNKEKGVTVNNNGKVEVSRARNIIECVKNKGKKVGIALNPDTPASVISTIITDIDIILVMTVWPGFGGQRYIDYVTSKIDELRKLVPDKYIEVDGGIDPKTVTRATSAGADVIVAGTSTFRANNMKTAIMELRESAMSKHNIAKER